MFILAFSKSVNITIKPDYLNKELSFSISNFSS